MVVYQDIGTGRIYTRPEGEWEEPMPQQWAEPPGGGAKRFYPGVPARFWREGV